MYNHEGATSTSTRYEKETVCDKGDNQNGNHDNQGNHDNPDSDEGEEDTLDTPTDSGPGIKRKDTNKTLVAPAAFALSGYPAAMGKKRYSVRRKPASSTNEHASTEGNESDGTISFSLENFDESD